MKLFVIHGWGGTYLEAADRLLSLLKIDSYWHAGNILVPARSATLLRHLLNEPADNPCYRSLCKLLVSRFLMSPPLPADSQATLSSYSRFAEDRLRRDFPHLGIPYGPASRRIRATQLALEAEQELQPLLTLLQDLRMQLATYEGDQTEESVRHLLQESMGRMSFSGNPLPLLESLREMHETGGDLDTVASAVLYATALRQTARAKGAPFRYGREFRFVFVNYHESLQSLANLTPAELYLADLPVAAFPSLAADIRFLHEQGVRTMRFEDHHPFTQEQRLPLETLLHEEKLGYLALSGPLQGDELNHAELACAADMVFASCVAGTPAETDGARRLRQAAHGEDFVTDRTPLGILLTDLIKGGICKVEIAQILLDAMERDDAMERLQTRGWARLPALWRSTLESTAENILENTALLQLADGKTRIICAKAVHADPGMPKLPTGKAIEFLARSFPDAHYAFYCFGASLMVARRLDHADTTLNLGSMMPQIGTTSDGGHAGAAVCRPDANPHYPRQLLGSVADTDFLRFSRYLAHRLTEAGYPVETVRNLSRPGRARWTSGTRKLIWIVAVSFLTGLLLVLFAPPFRPAQIRESNNDFLPHIDLGDEEAAAPIAGGDL